VSSFETPPADLLPESFANDLYESVGPVAREDPVFLWSLLILCNAIGVMYQLVDEWVRDTEEGPGWSLLVDLDRCPPGALDWLGQFVGVRLPGGLTPEEKRIWIKDASGFRRGTVKAMIAAVQLTLTGEQSVSLIERDGDPYYLTVAYDPAESPDQGRTMQAILSQKPAGLVLGTRPAGIQTWDEFKARQPTWAGEMTIYDDWQEALWNTQD
jgi:hypothetical protein